MLKPKTRNHSGKVWKNTVDSMLTCRRHRMVISCWRTKTEGFRLLYEDSGVWRQLFYFWLWGGLAELSGQSWSGYNGEFYCSSLARAHRSVPAKGEEGDISYYYFRCKLVDRGSSHPSGLMAYEVWSLRQGFSKHILSMDTRKIGDLYFPGWSCIRDKWDLSEFSTYPFYPSWTSIMQEQPG